ncbi:hypothetical protein N5C38_16635 [Pseudomonas chengduensis]|jgi:hypothetical protein|uniref:Uncharacterized protein n=1 Tax=Ectopseudomonas chengduensis TaxID=489632 RepID=A0A1G6VFI3_9GAMM|nr:hypothetical protein [Pseudomonas chengduensis]MBP3063823.1 hypothetical protein [Pseudomonas chengduensis]MDH0622491.1 hypothetical protein [Pseudomonas chengduensis]MDH1212671.1 hypothetical protein [Pseudomonas chengduensis]MDH1665803.1 hypothetical protein [Pseudomonas chengduensis]MDH1681674.1 hypothetical protein [Pseudomonas chengduensis]|tara:strand:+ start:426 stop:1079 length:654 start_codon:yes stop_codon:yes gene_type:complete
MKYLFLIAMLQASITSSAHAEDKKYIEQGNSIYFCSSPEAAGGLVETYDREDDFNVRNYVESSAQCERLPPSAEAKLYILTNTEENSVIKIEIIHPKLTGEKFFWINSQQANDQINYYNATLEEKPLAVGFSNEIFGCTTLEAAIHHSQISSHSKQTGGFYVAQAYDIGNQDKTTDFICKNIKPGTRADIYMNKAQSGFVPVHMYDKDRTILWIPAK